MVADGKNNRRDLRGKENIVISFDVSKRPIGQYRSDTTIVDCEVFRHDNPNEIFLTTASINSDLYLDILLEKNKLITNEIYDFHFGASIIENYDELVSEIKNKERVLVIENGSLSGFSEDYNTEITKDFN